MSALAVMLLIAAAVSIALMIGAALCSRQRWRLLGAASAPLSLVGVLSLPSFGLAVLLVAIVLAVVSARRQRARTAGGGR